MSAALIRQIERHAISRPFGDGTSYRSLSTDHTRRISRRFGMAGRSVDIAALERDIIPERYARNFTTFSHADQIQLLRARVSIVGVGGLGGVVAEILARTGIGTLILVDGDRFEESNLNRQLMSSEDRLGRLKVEAAAESIRRVNWTVAIRSCATYLDEANARDLLKDAAVAVDCLDSVDARFTLEAAAGRLNVPMVSAAVAGMFGQLTTLLPKDGGLQDIYGNRHESADRGVEASLGNLACTVFTMASLQCAEVVRVLLNRPGTLKKRMLIVDLAANLFEIVKL